jgi:hypothetical protein
MIVPYIVGDYEQVMLAPFLGVCVEAVRQNILKPVRKESPDHEINALTHATEA